LAARFFAARPDRTGTRWLGAARLARRANALVLLDQGMSCSAVAQVLFLDDDTIRLWYRLYQEDGFDGLVSFGYDGSACRLSDEQ
jgi:transposase